MVAGLVITGLDLQIQIERNNQTGQSLTLSKQIGAVRASLVESAVQDQV